MFEENLKKLKFKLVGRKAYLQNTKHLEGFKHALSYFSPAARFSPAYQRKQWDGHTSMVQGIKAPFISIGLLRGARKELRNLGYDCEILSWKGRPRVETKKGFWEENEKYDYQNQACRAILESYSRCGGTILSATGTGKTKTVAQVFSHTVGNVVFVVDQLNLLHQAKEELEKWLREPIGIIGESIWSPKRITVATVQTLQSAKTKRGNRFSIWAKTIEVMVIDELHKMMGRRSFKIINELKPKAIIGLTATLQMRKKIVRWKVYSIAGPILFEFPVHEGIERGVLSKCVIVQVHVPFVLESRSIYKNKKDPERRYMKHVASNAEIYRLLEELIVDGRRRRLGTIVLCDRLNFIREISTHIRKHHPVIVRGSTKRDKRVKITSEFERGNVRPIVASSVFTKGINIKRIGLIIDLAQRKNKDDAMQKLGRGLRLHASKNGLIYIDFVTKKWREKEGKSRLNAFKKAKLPVKVLDSENIIGKNVLQVAQDILKSLG